MALIVCPAGIAEASVETVWALVSEPDSLLSREFKRGPKDALDALAHVAERAELDLG